MRKFSTEYYDFTKKVASMYFYELSGKKRKWTQILKTDSVYWVGTICSLVGKVLE